MTSENEETMTMALDEESGQSVFLDTETNKRSFLLWVVWLARQERK